MRTRRTYTVGHRPFTEGVEEDEFGNPVSGHGAEQPLTVYAIAPTTSNEPETGRNLVVTGYTILLGESASIDYRDLFVIDGEEWKVEGEVANWNRGPFGYEPGFSVNLTRAEG